MKRMRFLRISVFVGLALCAPTLFGADAKPAATNAPPAKYPVTNQWDSSIAVGVTLTRGNSETFLSTLAFKAVRKTTNNEVLLGATGSYGESTAEETFVKGDGTTGKRDTSKRTAANAAAYGQFNYLFTERV